MSDDVYTYIKSSVAMFLVDRPDTDFQRGFLSALLVVAEEALGLRMDIPPFAEAQKLSRRSSGRGVPSLPAEANLSHRADHDRTRRSPRR